MQGAGEWGGAGVGRPSAITMHTCRVLPNASRSGRGRRWGQGGFRGCCAHMLDQAAPAYLRSPGPPAHNATVQPARICQRPHNPPCITSPTMLASHLHRRVHLLIAVRAVQQRGRVPLLPLLSLPPRLLGGQFHGVLPVGGALLSPLVALRDGGAGAAKVTNLRGSTGSQAAQQRRQAGERV